MRNIIERDRYVTYSYNRSWQPPTKNYGTTGNSYGAPCVVKRAGQGDLKKGDHVRALPYRAHEINVLPNFFFIEKKGRSTTDYWFENNKLKSEKTTLYHLAKGKLPIEASMFRYFGLDPHTFLPYINEGLKARANNKVLGKLKDSAVNLSVSMGEIVETRDSMARLLSRIAISLLNLLRGRYKKAFQVLGIKKQSFRSAARTFGDYWLAWALGIRPLMNDLFNGRQAIIDACKRPDTVIRVKAVEEETDKNPFNFFYPGHEFDSSSTVTQRVEVGLVARLETQWVDALATLGLLNPAQTAWELLPLTFVVDWFISIGDFLNTLSARMGLDFVSGYVNYSVKGKARVTRTNWSPDGSSGWSGLFPSWNMDIFSMQRIPHADFPHASVHLGGGIDSIQKLLTASSLIAVRAL